MCRRMRGAADRGARGRMRDGGGQGWNDLGFTSARDGVVIHGHPAYGDMLGQLLLTDNGGLTWHAVTSCNP